MAHALRYYYENTLKDGKVIRLEIHEKDGTKPAIPIGSVVQGLDLQIQGSEADIIAPITTTLLSMTFVDAPDLPEAATHKCGDWEEFYTPDSTYWKVILLGKDAGESEFRALWGGYITPDSYEEVLAYRGAVTIVARDNIGLLNDKKIPISNTPLTLSLSQFLGLTWQAIQSPMRLDISTNKQYLECEGESALDTFISVKALEDKSWYEALESILDSYGLVMRYIGDNCVSVSTMRDYPKQGKASYDDVQKITPLFVSGATRMLTPAAKEVNEIVNYDIKPYDFEPVKQEDFTGKSNYTIVIGDSANSKLRSDFIFRTQRGSGWCNPESPLFFNPHNYAFYKDEDNDKQYMFLSCNAYDISSLFGPYAEFSKTIAATDFVFHLEMGESYAENSNGQLYIETKNQGYVSAIVVVYAEQNGITQYLQQDGTWSADKTKLTLTPSGNRFELPIYMKDYVGEVLLGVQIYQIRNKGAETSTACYAPVKSASFTSLMGLMEKNTIRTIYNETNNLILERSPKFAPLMDVVALPLMVENAFFRKLNGSLPAKAWKWKDDTKNKPQQMAVYNHLQMLCYFLRPNNVLEGTIVNADVTRPACIWKWKDAEHILVGGTYDLLSGYIEGAILRQFARYEEQVYVKVAKSAAFVPKTGEILDVNIICWNMIDWQIEGLPAWITASKTSGKGEDTIQLTIAANNTGAVRVAEVIIGNAVLTITQKDRLGDFGIDFSLDYL